MLDTAYRACYNRYKLIGPMNKPMTCLESLRAQLKAQGRRVTSQRWAIVRALLNDGVHLTAEHVYTRVRQAMPDLSHATVYNFRGYCPICTVLQRQEN